MTQYPIGHARRFCAYCGRERPMKFIPEPSCAGCGAPVLVDLSKFGLEPTAVIMIQGTINGEKDAELIAKAMSSEGAKQVIARTRGHR